MAKFSVEEGEGPSSPKKRRGGGEEGGGASCDGGRGSENSESDKTIAVTIDPDVLDCSICLEPFIPPVFQCENGHTACSSCCIKLKNKCHTCSWPIGYTRCLAIEKVIESIKTSCQNAHYGCKEILSYSHKPRHEEICMFAPRMCPFFACNFTGSCEQLSLHFSTVHWVSAVRFRYNYPFQVSLDKNEPFTVLRGEDGLLFLINNRTESVGNAVSVTGIGPPSSKGGFVFDLTTRKEARSLKLHSLTKNATKHPENFPCGDFLLVPCDFYSGYEQPKLEVCIFSARELE